MFYRVLFVLWLLVLAISGVLLIKFGEKQDKKNLKNIEVITQCDKNPLEAREYIEMGALERENLYKETCEQFIRLDRYTGCYYLICK